MLPWRQTIFACLFERNTNASPHLPRVGLHMGSVRDRDLDPPNQGPACRRGGLDPRSSAQMPMADIAETPCDYKKARIAAASVSLFRVPASGVRLFSPTRL